MHETEQRMHSTAEHLDEPSRSYLHQKAREVSKMADERRTTARRAKDDPANNPADQP